MSGEPLAIYENKEVLGNAALLVLEKPVADFKQRAAHDILSSILKESFFDTLRTKQKTGYIVQGDCVEIENCRFHSFLVQSNSHQSHDLLHRFELFCESTVQNLSEMVSEERFSTLKGTLADSLQKYNRSLADKSALLDLLAFEKAADFNWIPKRVEGFASLSYENFLQEAEDLLSRVNRKRLAILMDGKIQDPFGYKEISRSDFIGEYVTGSELLEKETALSQ